MYPHEFTHAGKQYRATAIFEHGSLTDSPRPVCECEFLYKGEWCRVRNDKMLFDFGRMLAAQGLPVACRFYPRLAEPEDETDILNERIPF